MSIPFRESPPLQASTRRSWGGTLVPVLEALSASFLAREKRHVAAERCGCGSLLCARSHTLLKHTRTLAYLCYRLLVPHGCLFDEVVDFYIPVSTRNDHPGPPETDRHFHFSGATVLIPVREKSRQSDRKHSRSAKVRNSSLLGRRIPR